MISIKNLFSKKESPYWSTPDKDGKLPCEVKSCADCGHLYARVSWWCGSKEAIELRNTAIPGISNCSFWKQGEPL